MAFKIRNAPLGAYTIGQLCREFGATTRALRFYEEQGLLNPRRRQMARLYDYKDRARLTLIMRGRRVGLSLAEIREILDLYDEGEETQSVEALRIFRRRIEALEAQKREVDLAIQSLRKATDRLASRYPEAAVAARSEPCV